MPRFFEFSDPNISAAQRGELLFQRALATDRYIHARRAPYRRWRVIARLALFLPALAAVGYEVTLGVLNVFKLRGEDRLLGFLKVRGDVANFFPEMYLRQLENDHRRLSDARRKELNLNHWR